MKKNLESLSILGSWVIGSLRFNLILGSILEIPCEAIINAANGSLEHKGGVALAISKGAGPVLNEEGKKIISHLGVLKTGSAVSTSAGQLPFKGVIHTVGPQMGEGDEVEKLGKALFNALKIGEEKGWYSVHFPAISSGIFGVPLDKCARGYKRGLEKFSQTFPESKVKRVALVVLDSSLKSHIFNEFGPE